jgi:uncharacterized protein YidB (DUF937 family)
MGLLDTLGSMLGGSSNASSGLAGSLLEVLAGNSTTQGGGLGGLVQEFQRNGMGNLVASWIGTGQNLPVSAAQITQVLGPTVQAMAAQHGLSPDVVSQAISQLLPHLVDQMTPNGQAPQGADAMTESLSALRAKLGM